MEGWVKLHRKMLQWEWYDDPNTRLVFFHLLLIANHKPSRWQGIEVKPGQVITGRLKLALALKLSERQIRTALNNLKTTNEVTIKTTSQYSIITINNWDLYQSNDQRNDQQATNKRPTNDQQTTTNKNDKNDKKKGSADAATPKKSSFNFSEDHLRLAKELWAHIQESYPYYKQPNLEKWANEVRLINEVDGFTTEQIEDVAVWALCESEFWQKNIRSVDKLRKHFPKLIDQSGLYEIWRKKGVI